MRRFLIVSRSHAFASMVWAMVVMACVMSLGTLGYHLIGGDKYSWLNCFYMTFITVSTIGFGEILDFSAIPEGRVLTMCIATAGIATLTFMLSAVTAFILEGDLNQKWRKKKMQRTIDMMKDHYIICGVGRVGGNIANELAMTGRKFILIDSQQVNIDRYLVKYPDQRYLVGDATDNDCLLAAGVARARGIFAVAHDDTMNLVICLSARQLNPVMRIVARCHDMKNAEKTRRAGADEIVSPDFTGGLRLVSAMVRPQVVSFLDDMLKNDNNLRMEEMLVPASFAGNPLGLLQSHSREYVLLAIRHPEGKWLFNPQADHRVQQNDVLMVMTTPEGRAHLTQLIQGGA
jgi:voltage-gated potassium channel